MIKKSIYLHVGTPKTGSTSIQHFLTDNRRRLEQQGVAVYTALEPDPADCMRPDERLDPSFAGENGACWTKELVRRIQSRPEEKIILSEEMCWFSIVLIEKRPGFAAFVEQLKTIADVTLIVYLRRQDLFLMSSYQEHLKNGWLNGRTCSQQLNGRDHHYLHYKENIEWLISVVGAGKIIVRPFEAGQFFHNSLIADFLHCAGVSLTSDFVRPDLMKNPGMTPFLTEMMRCLSFFRYTRDELSVFWGPDCLADSRCYNGRKDEHQYLSPSDRRSYLRRFEAGNRWIAAELLGRSDGVLFKEDIPPETGTWTEYKLNKDEVRSFFKQAHFLNRSQRNRMCRQVLSVCGDGRPLSLRSRDFFEKKMMSENDEKSCRFLKWLNEPIPAPPSVCSAAPLFSIILPVHNRPEEVVRCLKSIQLQDFTDFEIIVVDDASTDSTPERVARLAQSDSRIKLIRLDENIGPGPARNIGIHQARGRYIRICDSDDFYPEGALSAFARRIAEREDDLIAGNLICWHSIAQEVLPLPGPWQIHRSVQSDDLRQLPELWTMVHFHRCAFRREFLLGNGIEYPAMRRGEDPVYMAKVLAKARSSALFSDPVYLFHARPRDQKFPYEDVRDAIAAHLHIRQIMSDAGYPELGFFFDCYHSPFTLSHARLTEEESLKISEQLIDFANRFSDGIFEHPYLNHPACDKIALHHDILVARNSTPEAVAELMKRGMFCGQAHLRQNEIDRLQRTVQNLRRQLRPFRFPLRIYRGLKRRLIGQNRIE
jgi:glycosyltransferase involved in cell wall biosynthesis